MDVSVYFIVSRNVIEKTKGQIDYVDGDRVLKVGGVVFRLPQDVSPVILRSKGIIGTKEEEVYFVTPAYPVKIGTVSFKSVKELLESDMPLIVVDPAKLEDGGYISFVPEDSRVKPSVIKSLYDSKVISDLLLNAAGSTHSSASGLIGFILLILFGVIVAKMLGVV